MATITNPVLQRATHASAVGALLTCALLTGFVCRGDAQAQAYTPPPPPLTTAPCVPTRKDPCDTTQPKPPATPATSDKFPFPGEPGSTPAAAPAAAPSTPAPAPQFPFPGEPGDAPAAPAPSSGAKTPQKTPADTAFPFPGEPDDSSTASSSSTPSSSDDPNAADKTAAEAPSNSPLKDAGSSGSTRFERRHLAKVEDKDHRELEDLEVSHYYMTTGNFLAAHLRAEDAVKLYPDDENAHLALAVSAEKLKKNDEAVAEYKTYLKMAPDGDKAKDAQRALQRLSAK